ncbi:MAG: O-antigen ligase family protein, partial [Pseudomonadota bacterium]
MVRSAQTVIGWIALLLVLVCALAIGGNIEAAWLTLAAGIFVLFVLQLVVDLIERHKLNAYLALAPAAVLFVASLAWSAPQWQFVEASGRVAIDPNGGALILARLAAYGMIFWIAARSCLDETVAGRFLIVIGGVVYAHGHLRADQRASGRKPHHRRHDRYVTGPFVNPNHFATYCAMGIIAMLGVLAVKIEQNGSGRWQRRFAEGFLNGLWFYVLATLIMVTALVLTLSRGGLIIMFIGVAVFIFTIRRGNLKQNATTAIIVLVLLGSFATFTGMSYVLPELLYGDQGGIRRAIYLSTMAAIADRPLFGYGLASFDDIVLGYLTAEVTQAGVIDFAHNSYLENVLELGVPAAILFYGALALVLLKLWQGAGRRRRLHALPAAGFAVGTLVAVHALLDFSMQMPGAAALFAFILGLSWA